MLILCNETPTAEAHGARIVMSMQSGRDTVDVSLAINEAILLGTRLLREAYGALDDVRPTAEVIPLAKRRRRRTMASSLATVA